MLNLQPINMHAEPGLYVTIEVPSPRILVLPANDSVYAVNLDPGALPAYTAIELDERTIETGVFLSDLNIQSRLPKAAATGLAKEPGLLIVRGSKLGLSCRLPDGGKQVLWFSQMQSPPPFAKKDTSIAMHWHILRWEGPGSSSLLFQSEPACAPGEAAPDASSASIH